MGRPSVLPRALVGASRRRPRAPPALDRQARHRRRGLVPSWSATTAGTAPPCATGPRGIAFGGSLHTVSQTRDWVIPATAATSSPTSTRCSAAAHLSHRHRGAGWLILGRGRGPGLGRRWRPSGFTMSPPSGHYYARWDDSGGISVVWEGMDLMDLALPSPAPTTSTSTATPSTLPLSASYNMSMAPETICGGWSSTLSPARSPSRAPTKEDWTFNLQLSAMDWSTEGMSVALTLHHVDYWGCRPGGGSAGAGQAPRGPHRPRPAARGDPGRVCSSSGLDDASRPGGSTPDTADHITAGVRAGGRRLRRGSQAFTPAPSRVADDGKVVASRVQRRRPARIELFDAARVSVTARSPC